MKEINNDPLIPGCTVEKKYSSSGVSIVITWPGQDKQRASGNFPTTDGRFGGVIDLDNKLRDPNFEIRILHSGGLIEEIRINGLK